MFSKFDEEAQKILIMAKKEMSDLCHPYVGSEHLLLSILHCVNLEITKMLMEYGITYKSFKDEIIKIIGIGKTTNTWFLFTPLLKRIIENAIYECKDENSMVTVEKLFISLLEEGEGVANRILLGMNIDINFLYERFSNKMSNLKHRGEKKILLEEFAIDLNQYYMENGFDPVIGRNEYIERMIEVLLRRIKNNPLLIGDAGVGKTALVEELVRRIVTKNVPYKLQNYKILSVSMGSLVAGTKYRGEFEERINKIICELENVDNIILFIDEIHTLVGAGGADGAIDAANILKPYLARGKIKIIGATTKEEYCKYIEKERALDRRFQKIYIEEPDAISVKNILLKIKPIYENYHSVLIDDKIIDLIVDLSTKYISQGKMPDKVIDILDEVCCKASIIDTNQEKKVNKIYNEIEQIKIEKNNAIIAHNYKLASDLKIKHESLENQLNILSKKIVKVKNVTEDNVYDVIFAKTRIPIKNIINFNFNTIYDSLTKVVLGQDAAITEIINVINNSNKNVPLSLFLVGKSGVGKTFFVKEYAKLLYPKEAFIKIDMSEYKEKHAISKIIGAPPGYVGYNDSNFLLAKVKQYPYSVILLDEIEKAHPDVIRLFLQVFDDGRMTSSAGEIVDFSHVIIFMTSNIGTSQNNIGFANNGLEHFKNKIKDFLGVEFLNRLNAVVYFNEIDEKTVNKIIKLRLKNSGFKNISTEIVEKLKAETEFRVYGVRKLNRILDNYINSNIYNH